MKNKAKMITFIVMTALLFACNAHAQDKLSDADKEQSRYVYSFQAFNYAYDISSIDGRSYDKISTATLDRAIDNFKKIDSCLHQFIKPSEQDMFTPKQAILFEKAKMAILNERISTGDYEPVLDETEATNLIAKTSELKNKTVALRKQLEKGKLSIADKDALMKDFAAYFELWVSAFKK